MAATYSQKFSLFKNEIKQALEDEDDVLAAYSRFVEWLAGYEQDQTRESSADSPRDDGDLLIVLEEAIRRLKEDPLCLSDRRYLKLWIMFAKRVDIPEYVYAYMFANKIGTMYSPIYEEYAKVLEMESKLKEANGVYQEGISNRVRGIDKLKRCYVEFQERVSNRRTLKGPSRNTAETSNPHSLRKNPLKNFPDAESFVSSRSSPTHTQVNSDPKFVPSSDPYIHMTQPAASGSKRPERLRFDLTLLFKDGQEYCIQEARARSLGLLGKKWGPPPSSEQSSTSQDRSSGKSGSSKSHGSTNNNRMMMTMNITSSLNKVGGGAEPTVTINTKEALRDVFGMYNSPERSAKQGRASGGRPNGPVEGSMAPPPPPIGSKHAPVRKVEPMTPAQAQPLSSKNAVRDVFVDENASTKATFKPFVDEASKKENVTPAPSRFKPFIDDENSVTPAPAKYKPFVDEDAPNPKSQVTPGPRRALSLKEISTPVAPTSDTSDENHTVPAKSLSSSTGSIFARVFTPAGKTDKPFSESQMNLKSSIGVFRDPDPDTAQTPASEKQQQKATVFAARSTLTAHRDDDVPKASVFSRPVTDGSVHRPPAFKPVSALGSSTPKAEPLKAEPVFRKVGLSASQSGVNSSGPQRSIFASASSLQSASVFSAQTPRTVEHEANAEGVVEVDDSFDDDIEDEQVVQTQIEEEDYAEDQYDEDQYAYGADSYRMGGGRCGAYDVMTPIAERTCEFTMSTRAFGTPSDREIGSSRSSGIDAVEAAARLARELKEDEKNGHEGVFRLQARIMDDDENDLLDLDEEIDDVVEKTGTLSLADAILAASSFKPPNPCVPSDPQIIATLLSLFPLEPEFHDHRGESAQLLDGIQKFVNKSSRRGSTKSNSSRSSDESSYEVELKGRVFEIREKLGEGGFGAVFMAKDVSADDGDDGDDEYANVIALKIVRPRSIWEYHILRSIHSTLPASIRRSIIQPRALYAFKDESFLVLDLCRQGTLLDVVNRAAQAGVMQQGACLDELLVVFFSIELLRFVDVMHSAGFIHGDLKIDNCLLRLEEVPGVASAWSGLYQPSGEGGWCYKGIKMIDFGRTINTRLFPSGQQFIADWKTDARDCMEMNQNKPWSYQTDYFGLAGIIYCLLYGKYFEASTIVQGSNGRYKLSAPFKRYWQVDLWTRLFDALLNPTMIHADGSLPICQELGELRVEMEEWLQNNCNRTSISLKSLLKKVELSILEL